MELDDPATAEPAAEPPASPAAEERVAVDFALMRENTPTGSKRILDYAFT